MLRALKLIAGSSLLIGLAFTAFADPPQNAPISAGGDHGVMGGKAGMMGQMPSSPGNDHAMMGSMAEMMQQMTPEMREQMTRMTENCNRMMESHMQQHPPASAPLPEKKG